MTHLEHLQFIFLEASEWVRTAEREVIEAKETLFRSSVKLEFANRGSIEANQLRYEMAERALSEAIENRGVADGKFYAALKEQVWLSRKRGLSPAAITVTGSTQEILSSR